jgi:hypothetical protein
LTVTPRIGLVAGLAALAGCGGDPEQSASRPTPAATPSAAFVAQVDAVCRKTQDASRAGPRFPYRTFDPSNPDGRLRAVGRFYRRLDTEGTLASLERELAGVESSDGAPAGFGELLDGLAQQRAATRVQTRAAQSGDRERMIDATAKLDAAVDAQHLSAADFGAFGCALSLERNPKTLR